MRIKNTTPNGPTVFITDLKLRIGSGSIPVSVKAAVTSSDLRSALDQGVVQLEVDPIDRMDPRVEDLVTFAKFADAKREGKLLFAQAERALMTKQPVNSPDVSIRPAVFESVV